MSVIELADISKKFGKFTALDAVSFNVEEGEVFGFIGPNGAGKTTTLRILLGMIQATSGEAKIFGKDVWDEAIAIHKRIAYVPGDINLWDNLTGGEVIDFFLKMQGAYPSTKKEAMMKRFDFDPSKKCKNYSKGNKQKVALIAAFSSDADLYIFDEPTSGLDPLMEKVFQESVHELKRNGKSVLLSSHILSEVESLCDKVCIIREGRVIESGTLSDMRHLTRSTVRLSTRKEINDLSEWIGVHDVKKENDEWIFLIDSDKWNSFITRVSGFDVEKIESHPPTLEDLFMRHYQDDGGDLDG
ncbi:ABC transporter ATP-binding protein [Lacticigenium naphthae]|uniref:ABC transporter ATP-binding protein n=1 Tax=Lacticigenium naphthae TaxID=515351 RepID=UPI0004050033|nr:ABC transporter ATP-binding protein [Lacticigenium naphthae]